MRIRPILMLFIASLVFVSSELPAYSAGKVTLCLVVYSNKKAILQTVRDNCVEVLSKKQLQVELVEYNLETDKLEYIIQNIRERKPAVIFTLGSKAYETISQSIHDIPIVFSAIYYDENSTIKENSAGVSIRVSESSRVGLLSKIFPEAKTFGLFYSKESQKSMEEVRQACQERGITVVAKKIESEKDFPVKLSEISSSIDVFYIIPDNSIYFLQSIKHLLLEGLRQKMPVIGLSSLFTKAGAILSMEFDYNEVGRQTAEVAVRIIEGEKPSAIGVVTPQKLNYSINLQVAERTGKKFSQELINGASEVFGQ